jgi:REP element-mobilizing transposase RayT
MADTFIQNYIHIVIAVKGRACLISSGWKDKLFAYITGIIQNYGHKVMVINGVADHVHIFISLKPTQAISDLVMNIKRDSSVWINSHNFMPGKFQWQNGYGAFSYSHSHVDKVIKYILNQEEHHKRKSFKDEYINLLEAFKIEYKQEYLFEWINADKV